MFPRLGSDGAIRIRKKDQRVRWLSQGKAGEFKRLRAVFGAGYDAAAEDFQPCYVTDFNSTTVTGRTGLTPPTPMSVANCPPTGGPSSPTANSLNCASS